MLNNLLNFFQERDFDKHAQYYGAEPKAQELLREDKHLKEFFEVCFFFFFFLIREGTRHAIY